jgi:hypothetical protein
MSCVVILHDGIGRIKEDTEFGKKLHDAILNFRRDNRFKNILYSGNGNVGQVVAQDHADGYHAVIMGGNTGWDFGVVAHRRDGSDKLTDDEWKLAIVRRMASDLGYTLRKRPKKR